MQSKPPAEKQPPDYLRHPAMHDDLAGLNHAERRESLEAPHRHKSAMMQLAVFFIVLLLWRVPIVNPIKLLVVLFHELSHMAAALATGGVVFGMAIDPAGAGVTLGMGGNMLVIIFAGYVGSMLVGYVLYAMSALWEPSDLWGALLVFSIFSLAMRWLNDFTIIFGIGTMAMLLFGQLFFPDHIKKFCIRMTATTCCMYPLLDISSEWLFDKNGGFHFNGEALDSDTAQLSRLLQIDTMWISITWSLIGLAVAWYLILWSARMDARTLVKRRFFGKARVKLDFEDPLYDASDPKSGRDYILK